MGLDHPRPLGCCPGKLLKGWRLWLKELFAQKGMWKGQGDGKSLLRVSVTFLLGLDTEPIPEELGQPSAPKPREFLTGGMNSAQAFPS